MLFFETKLGRKHSGPKNLRGSKAISAADSKDKMWYILGQKLGGKSSCLDLEIF